MKNTFTIIIATKKKFFLSTALLMIFAGGFFILKLLLPVPVVTEEKKKEKGLNPDRPDLALEQDIRRTKDPVLGYVPRERLALVFDLLKQQKNNPPSTQTVATWVERGPNNVGGRTRALMFDPNDVTNKKVWAGGVSGGLWYTNDITAASPTWVAVDDFWANLAISCIAYDPSNTQIMYVGTGEGWYNSDAVRGLGVWKTTDGGTTWSQLASTNNTNFMRIQDIVVSSTGVVYVATRQAGVQRSTNGGTSFSQVLSGAAADLEISANGTLWATIGIFTVGGIYSSSDGISWTQQYASAADEYRIEVACAPSNANTIYAMVQSGSTNGLKKVIKSTNGGFSWSSITQPLWYDQNCVTPSSDMTRTQAWYDLIAAVHPTDANTVYLGGVDLMKSTDGGSTWTQISSWWGGCGRPYVHADQHAIAFRPGTPTSLAFGNDGGVHYTTDGGSTFSEKNSGYNVTQFYAGAIHPTAGQNEFLAGAQDNGTQRFTSAGMNSTTEVTGGDGAFCFIDQSDPSYQISAYVYNNYYLTTNSWASYLQISSGSTGDFINPADYDDRENILYSAYSTTQCRRINNITGTPGSPVQFTISGMSALASHIRVSPYAPAGTTTLFVGTENGRLYKVTNAQGTPTTTEITGTGSPWGTSATISCVEIGASESQLVVTFSNYGVTSVWYTTDGGSSWSNKENNLPDMPVRWALFNPNNNTEVFLATEVGVWSTDDITVASPTWTANNSGLANVRVDMLQIRSSDKEVIAVTHGRGLFSTNAFGTSPPVANFTGSPTTVCAGNNVTFTDASTNSPTSWSWTFESGTPSSSTSQNPVVTYNTPGTFSVSLTVTNGAGSDTETKLAYITVNANPSNSAITTNVSCNGGSDGAIDLTVTGGTSPYTYSWSPGGQTTQDITSLTAGTYTVLTTSSNGCTDEDSYTVTQPSVLSVSMSSTNVSCNGGSNGTASATPSGGTSPYTFSWSPGGQTTSAITGLSAGNYTCNVTDNKGCATSGTVAVTQPAVLTVSMSKTDANCTSSDGTATASPSGGTSPYTYSWNTGGSTQTISNLAAGNYTCTVTDANGCTATGTVNVGSTPCGPTQLQAPYCGITLSAMNQLLYCVYASGATNYQYRVTHSASGFSATYTRTNWFNDFSMDRVSGVQYGKTYEVEVRAYVGGSWSSWGAICTVTTPASIPTTQLQPAYCGITLTALSQLLYCNSVAGASNYQYRVTHSASGFSSTYTRNGSWFNDFSMDRVSGVQYGKTYDVEVRAYVGGVWGNYGTICTITTPASIPTTQLQPAYCGITLSSMSQLLYCNSVNGASNYEYKITKPDLSFTAYYTRGNWFNDFAMNRVNGIEFNTLYNVEARANVGGVWGNYGTLCTVTTSSLVINPDLSKAENILPENGFALSLYPNPVLQEKVYLKIQAAEENIMRIEIFDLLGIKIYSEETKHIPGQVIEIDLKEKFSKGVYFLQAVLNNRKQNVKFLVVR